jgi:uncharacterized membrane protein
MLGVVMVVVLVVLVVFAAGRRHHGHGHGDAVRVSRRIAIICLREYGAGGGVSILHMSGDGAR